MRIIESVLEAIAPGIDDSYAAEVVYGFNTASERWQVNTPLRAAHFLATMAHESAGFRRVRELMNYKAERLMQVWPSRFPTKARAEEFAHQGEKLANEVYGGRLGNTEPGDGWKFRGWGIGQITGRENTKRVEDLTGFAVLYAPALMDDVSVGTICSLALWHDKGCNAPADRDDMAQVTRIWQGGDLGLAERRKLLAKAKRAVGIL